jgi:hypothetical protein
MDVRFEQRINIKLCAKLGKTATETLQLLRDAYGDKALSWAEKRAKGRRHENFEASQAAAQMELAGMSKEAITSCFQDLQKRWQQCIDCGGYYFEGHMKH